MRCAERAALWTGSCLQAATLKRLGVHWPQGWGAAAAGAAADKRCLMLRCRLPPPPRRLTLAGRVFLLRGAAHTHQPGPADRGRRALKLPLQPEQAAAIKAAGAAAPGSAGGVWVVPAAQLEVTNPRGCLGRAAHLVAWV